MPELRPLTLHLALVLSVLLMPWQLCHAFIAITQNMAEMGDADPTRIRALLNNLARQQPDIVFLQEAERVTLKSTPSAFDKDEYKIIYQETNGLPSGGLVILAKRALSPRETEYRTLPSELDRGLLLTRITICETEHTVVDLHLESPYIVIWKSNAMRQRQIQELKKIMVTHSDFIVAGDFNLVFDDESEREIPADWMDAWAILHPDEPGYTWDPKTNERAMKEGLYILPGFRLDRLMLKSKELGVKSSKLLSLDGKQKLSDHYGMHASLDCKLQMGP